MVPLRGFILAAACVLVLPMCQSSGVASTDEPVNQLASRDAESARAATEATFRAGTAALPTLLALRGNQTAFTGGALGNPMSAQMTLEERPGVARDQIVTVEVAALYLINAIYHRRLDFAQSAYLTDINVPPNERTAANTPARVARAWESVARWYDLVRTASIDELRRKNIDPFMGSGIRFW